MSKITPNQITESIKTTELDSTRDVTAEISLQVFALIPRLMQQIRRELRSAGQKELTVPQFRILAKLDKGTLNHKDLADWIGVSLPAISRMITLLAEKGYVTRDRYTADRRNVGLSLTDKGYQFFHECRKKAQKSFAHRFNELSLNEKVKLNNALDVLSAATLQPEEEYEKSRRRNDTFMSLGVRTSPEQRPKRSRTD